MFELTTMDIFINLALAATLGLMVGLERSVAGKTAGMRTFALVSLGSALFVTTSILITNEYLGRINFDLLRVLSSIVTGVGFIGAGLIVFREQATRGLTTAAGLWVSAGIGAAVGFGLYAIAVFTTLLTLLIFTAVWFIENHLKIQLKKDAPLEVETTTTVSEDINE
jgi:putative Mg2+ transporter-C (MgtC) family protein